MKKKKKKTTKRKGKGKKEMKKRNSENNRKEKILLLDGLHTNAMMKNEEKRNSLKEKMRTNVFHRDLYVHRP